MKIVQTIVKKLFRDYIAEEYENNFLIQGREITELKRKSKLQSGEKITVVFVCHRAQIWSALKTVFEACNEDEQFETIIVTIPNKKQIPKLGLNHEEYVSEGAEEFYKDYPCRVIQGYDYKNKTWFDLETLNPDYVFFQTPYDICRPPQYRSNRVALYAKICYVHYGMPFMGDFIAEESFPVSFLKHTYFHFAEFKEMKDYYVNRVDENPIHRHERVILTGYPKLDGIKNYIGIESKSWHYKDEQKRYRIMWTPRWSMGEGNCTFFEYKDKLLDYVEEKKNIEFLFRPHPQAFSEFIEKKLMTKEEVDKYCERYASSNTAFIDEEREYLPSFYSSDVLITDESSIIPEYFLTEKPIIFTYNVTHLNEFAKKIAEGFYWVKDWQELQETLEMLMRGEDPLLEKRKQLIGESYFMPEKGSGYEIKEAIKRDFYSQNIFEK